MTFVENSLCLGSGLECLWNFAYLAAQWTFHNKTKQFLLATPLNCIRHFSDQHEVIISSVVMIFGYSSKTFNNIG